MYTFFAKEIACSQVMTCAMRPPSSFRLAEKKTVRARARRKGRQRDEPLYSSVARHRDRRTWYSSGAKSMPRLSTPSRVQERGEIPVRSTMERQRNAGFQTTPHCSSGDPGRFLGFPAFARSPEDTSSGRLSWSPRTVLSPTGKNGSWAAQVIFCGHAILVGRNL